MNDSQRLTYEMMEGCGKAFTVSENKSELIKITCGCVMMGGMKVNLFCPECEAKVNALCTKDEEVTHE